MSLSTAKIAVRCIACLLLASALSRETPAQSWPTYRHDNRRSGITDAKLEFPLTLQWVWKSPQPPQTAWTGPAKWDAYSGNSGLQSMRNFDPCFYVTVSGNTVFFGSSADDAAHAVDAKTGQEQWVHFTGAAVRLPPTIADGRVLFGSDDGYVYCCDEASGKLIWRRQASQGNQRITSNRKIISLWPVRTGVLVDGQRATFAGSLVPWNKSVLWTVDAATGETSGEGSFRSEVSDVTLQGAMLASKDLVYVPQGRAAPLAFDRADGSPRGAMGEAGGVFCILSEDETLLAGPPHQKEKDNQIRIADIRSKQPIASFSGTNRILVAGDLAWLSIEGKLKLLDRASYVDAQGVIDRATSMLKKAGKPIAEFQAEIEKAKQKQLGSWKWSVDSPTPLDMIMADDVILLGLENEVRAVAANDGSEIWRASVNGVAHGLAVANGQLFVSTDRGHIYSFGAPE